MPSCMGTTITDTAPSPPILAASCYRTGMTRPLCLCALLFTAACARRAPAPVPETSATPAEPASAASVDSAPAPGPTGWSHAGANPDRYTIGVDSQVAHGGRRSAFLESHASASAGMWSTIPQTIDAAPYLGRRLRVSAYLRGRAPASCEAFVRVDGQYEGKPATLRFTSTEQKPQRCGAEWREFSLVVDVPEGSEKIVYGFGIKGRGRVWIDDVGVMAVDSTWRVDPQEAGLPRILTVAQQEVADTTQARLEEQEAVVMRPENLGFEH